MALLWNFGSRHSHHSLEHHYTATISDNINFEVNLQVMNQIAIYVLFALGPLWIISLFLFSKAAWSNLARKYKSSEFFHGTEYGRFDARINDLNYTARLRLKYNEEGIYLRVVKYYRPFHPPLFIPWNELVAIKKVEKHVLIDFGIGEKVDQLQVSTDTYEKLEETLIFYKDEVKASLE